MHLNGLEKDINYLEKLITAVNNGERLGASINGIISRIKKIINDVDKKQLVNILLINRFERLLTTIKDVRMFEIEKDLKAIKQEMEDVVAMKSKKRFRELHEDLEKIWSKIKMLKMEQEILIKYYNMYTEVSHYLLTAVFMAQIRYDHGGKCLTDNELNFMIQFSKELTDLKKTAEDIENKQHIKEII